MTKRKPAEVSMQILFLLCGLVAVAFVLLITAYLIAAGLPAIRQVGLASFLFGRTWDSTNETDPRFGILPLILTSVYGAAGAIVVGVPIGLLTAIFLAKAAPPRLAGLLRPAVSLLAGIPSVVYGLVGMCVLVPALRAWLNLPAGDSLLAAILVLAVMILPSVIDLSAAALEAVPKEYEEASLALGISPGGEKRYCGGGGFRDRPGYRRSNGHSYGSRKRSQYAVSPKKRPLPYHRHCH